METIMHNQEMATDNFIKEVIDEEYTTENKILKVEKSIKAKDCEDNLKKAHDQSSFDQIIASLNEMGNADRFISKFSNMIRYCDQTKSWYTYQDGRWVKNRSNLFSMYKQIVDDIRELANTDELTLKEKEKIIALVSRFSSIGKFNGMLKAAQNDNCIRINQDELDADPLLLNCQNGTLNLATHELQPHDSEYLLTKIINAPYDPEAKCPEFDNFIRKIMNHDKEKIEFLQRSFGYALTGKTTEQCLFIFYGSGSNGKSTLIEIFRELTGDYSAHTPSNTLLSSKFRQNSNDVARLKGARFVSAVEVGIGEKIDESLLKQLTGGDQITARFLFHEFFEYRSEFKIFLAANHLPEIRGVDDGVWRRIRLIPFDVTIPVAEIDKELSKKLKQELPGFLNWVVEGCYAWQERGLNPPNCIISAIEEYRKDMDQISGFIEDECIKQDTLRVPISNLYIRYQNWADLNCKEPVGKNIFGKLMKQKGYKQSKSGSQRYWNRLKLK